MSGAEVLDEVNVPPVGLRRVPKQARSRARVDAAISAFVQMVGEGDERSITLADIADRIGVPLGSLYEYFEDVTSVADAAVDRMLDRHDELLRGLDIDGLASVHEFIDVLFDAYLQLYADQPAFITLRNSQLWNQQHGTWLTERVEGFLSGALALVWRRAGGRRGGPPARRTGLIFSAADAMLQRILRDGAVRDPVLVADARATLKFMVDQLSPPTSRNRGNSEMS